MTDEKEHCGKDHHTCKCGRFIIREDMSMETAQQSPLNKHDLIQFLTGWGINDAHKLGSEICERFGGYSTSGILDADEITLAFLRKYLKMPNATLEDICKRCAELIDILEWKLQVEPNKRSKNTGRTNETRT